MYAHPTLPDKTSVPVTTETRFRMFLDLAIQAPCLSQRALWRFKIRQHQLDFRIDLSHVDEADLKSTRLAYIDAGILLFYLKTVIRGHGLEPVVFTFPDFEKTDLIAYIWLGPASKANGEELEWFNWLLLTYGSRKVENGQKQPTGHLSLAEYLDVQNGNMKDFKIKNNILYLNDTGNHPAAWLNAGMNLAKLCLDASTKGIKLSPNIIDAPLSQGELTAVPLLSCDSYDQGYGNKRSLLDFLL